MGALATLKLYMYELHMWQSLGEIYRVDWDMAISYMHISDLKKTKLVFFRSLNLFFLYFLFFKPSCLFLRRSGKQEMQGALTQKSAAHDKGAGITEPFLHIRYLISLSISETATSNTEAINRIALKLIQMSEKCLWQETLAIWQMQHWEQLTAFTVTRESIPSLGASPSF